MTEVKAGGASTAVFFDVDGTLVEGTIVHYYVYFRKRLLPPFVRPIWYGLFLMKCLYFLLIDKIDRSFFNVRFYKGYGGLSASKVKALAGDCFRDIMLPRLYKHAPACVSAHRQAGRTIVLLTGSLDFIIAPLAKELAADAVIAPGLLETNGRFTGSLNGPPISDQEKAKRVRAFAEERDIDLSQSYAYADSVADLPMLELVGHPNTVNPDKRLSAIAKQRGWPIHRWTTAAHS